MSIKLSLICPMYKVSNYLHDLIDSLIDGVNSCSVEVIFVDDCCPENSGSVCSDYLILKEKDIKFKYKQLRLKENSGQGSARNSALKLISGEYIGFIDSDDIICSDYWLSLNKEIDKSVYDIIEFGFREFYDTKSAGVGKSVLPKTISDVQLTPFLNGFFVWSRVYRKEVLQRLSFPESGTYEDIYFSIKACCIASSIKFITKPLVRYRKRSGSITSVRNSGYSKLLDNMVTAAYESWEIINDKNSVLRQISRYSFLMTLKGVKVKGKNQRVEYYRSLNYAFKRILIMFEGTYDFARMKCYVCFILIRLIGGGR